MQILTAHTGHIYPLTNLAGEKLAGGRFAGRAPGLIPCAMPKTRRAIAALEMIIVLPVLLFVMLGMIEFGQYFYVRNVFESAARDAVRAAIPVAAQTSDPTTAATRALAQENIPFSAVSMIMLNDATGQTVTDCTTIQAGAAVTVYVYALYYQLPNVYRPFNDMTGHGISNSKYIVSECTMIRE